MIVAAVLAAFIAGGWFEACVIAPSRRRRRAERRSMFIGEGRVTAYLDEATVRALAGKNA